MKEISKKLLFVLVLSVTTILFQCKQDDDSSEPNPTEVQIKEKDCAGVEGGSAKIDDCGVCAGGTTGKKENESCTDCADVVNGSAKIDDCGVCAGGTTGKKENENCTDCAGVVNGSAKIDDCGVCTGGTTGKEACNVEVTYGNGVTDIDGNAYTSVIIGDQEWMAENLKVTKYNDGSSIILKGANVWTNTGTLPMMCWYDGNADNKDVYGGLYNAYAIKKTLNAQEKLCPTGWHVPTNTEWKVLRNNISPIALKSKTKWNGTNVYGFSAMAAGLRQDKGTFMYVDNLAYWWSSTTAGSDWAWAYSLSNQGIKMSEYNKNDKGDGYSVRCIKN